MTTINITVQSLLNSSSYDLQFVDTAGTIGDLKTAMETNFSYSAAWFELVFNDEVLDTAQTIGSYGIVDGSVLRIQNNIPNLATKQARQVAKLELAQLRRQAGGDTTATYYRARNVYDITQLPTTYKVGDNDTADVVDNPNLGELTLIPGNIRTGVKKVTYAGYHTDDVAFTDTATVTDTTTATNFTIASIAETTTVLYTGYLLADYTGTWTFTITSDDASYLWIGNTAVTGYTTSNELATASYLGPGTGTIGLTADEYYPIRLLYGNGPSGGNLNLTYAHTGTTATNNFTDKLFSPGVKLVVGRPWIEAP